MKRYRVVLYEKLYAAIEQIIACEPHPSTDLMSLVSEMAYAARTVYEQRCRDAAKLLEEIEERRT